MRTRIAPVTRRDMPHGSYMLCFVNSPYVGVASVRYENSLCAIYVCMYIHIYEVITNEHYNDNNALGVMSMDGRR